MPESSQIHYKVLARKYRPATFRDLVGQEVVVTTLSNAIKSNRVAHAFLLTGIRGIGKTTTARIIAKTLNCNNLDTSQDIITPCETCPNCLAFAKESHPDVIEMDAASKTGVNDVRELIEGTNYRPLLGTTKIYIIDEVHMLSNNAFNALLKTLEEPAAHAKFIFATTEVRKIPITILSRCQRFDLKRLSNELMNEHLSNVARLENVNISKDGLNLISLKSEGSVRDALSLLDQVITFSAQTEIDAELIRKTLGISSKTKLFELLEFIATGEVAKSIDALKDLYLDGHGPLILIEDLMDLIHLITKMKLMPQVTDSEALSEEEIKRGNELAQRLTVPVLTTIWQMLFKGLSEIRNAPNEMNATEMVLIRLCYLTHLPSLNELINSSEKRSVLDQSSLPIKSERLLPKEVVTAQKIAPLPSKEVPSQQRTVIVEESQKLNLKNFDEVMQLFFQKKELIIYHHLREDVHLVEFNPSTIKLRLANGLSKTILGEIANLLNTWTGTKWQVISSSDEGAPTLEKQQQMQIDLLKEKAKDNEIVKSVFDHFEGANITNVKPIVS